MAYNLTMQLNLQGPSALELDRIRRQLESSLSGLNMSISTKGVSQANSQIKSLTGNLNQAGDAAERFLEAVGKKFTTFAAYTVASTAILKFADVVATAFQETTKLEAEMLKISQITNRSTQETLAHSEAIFAIAKRYNITASKVASLTGTLAQTGLSFRDAAKGAELLAKTSLLSTFDSLSNTTEGLIAIINTFELSMDQAGLALEAMNTVSKKYAVESSDLVDVVRRTGGAFRAAGGDVNELFALFTSVRQTTRESSETIATGMRTIFARIQRPETIQYFKDLGIELASIDGKLVGPFEAIQRISNGLKNLGITAGDVRFSEVVEEIGGIRQISKVIPLLTQTKLQTEALATAQNGTAESAEDVRKAQEGLIFQFGQLQKNFQEFTAEIVGSNSFRFLIKNVIDLTNGLITLGRTLADLLPLFAVVFGVQGLGSAFNFGKAITSGQFSPLKRASGGFVPGTGDGDTVPAMLTPGEFVINKKSAQMFGYGNLKKINKYAKGGVVQHFASGGEVGGFVGGVSDAGQDIFQKIADALSPVVLQFARLYLQTQLYTSVLSGLLGITKGAIKAAQDQVDAIKAESKGRKDLRDAATDLDSEIIKLEGSIRTSQANIEKLSNPSMASRRSYVAAAGGAAFNVLASSQVNGINQQSAPVSNNEKKRYNKAVTDLINDFGATSIEVKGLAQALKQAGNDQRAQHDVAIEYTNQVRKAVITIKRRNANIPEVGPLTLQQSAIQKERENIGKAQFSINAKTAGISDINKQLGGGIFSKINSLGKTEISKGGLRDTLSASNAFTNALMQASTVLNSYFISSIMKASEASQKLADEAVKSGNAKVAGEETAKAVAQRQQADRMSTGATSGAALGFLALGPLGAAIGGLAGAFLGTTKVMQSFTDWLSGTNSEMEQQSAKRKAVAEAEINALDKTTGKTNERASLLSKTNTRAATAEFAKGILQIDKQVKSGQISYTNTETGNAEDVQQRLRTQFDLLTSEFEKLSQLPENAGKGFNELSAEIPGFKESLALITNNMKDGALATQQFKIGIEASNRARDINAARERGDKLKSAVDNVIKYQEDIFKRQSEKIGIGLEDQQRAADVGSRLNPTKDFADFASSSSIKAIKQALSQTQANRANLFGGLEGGIAASEANRQELSRKARNIPARAGEEQNVAQVQLQKATENQISMIETQIRLDQEELSIQERLVAQMTTRVDREIEAASAVASFKKGLLEQFATGSISDRNRLGATSAFAKNALATGDLSNVPQELKTSVIELLKGIGQEKDAIAIQAREVERGTGGRISFEQAKKGLEGQATPTEALKSAINAQAEAIKEQRAIQERISQENAAKSKLELENAANFRDAVNIFREAADILAGNRPMPVAANGPPQQMEVAAVQDVTVNIPGLNDVVNQEVAKATYKAISDKFTEMASKLDGVTSPEGIANSFREAAV